MNLQGRVVLITGASRGLGREIALRFAERGADLVLTARGVDGLEDVARSLDRHAAFLAMPGDVSDRRHAERLVSAGLARFGHIDVLINNA